jgi:glucose-6-phosphate 1-epimerase
MRLPEGVLPFLDVHTARCRARVTPFGAQVCEWTPAGQASPVLFLSPRVILSGARPIRGGVPVCFPWFGDHPSDATKPAHGFVRTRMWDIAEVTRDDDVRMVFRLGADAETRALWDAEFVATLTVTLSTTLTMAFEVRNDGGADITWEAALHTYLAVGDVSAIRIAGLERTRYLDKPSGFREKRTDDDTLTFAGEMDRVFLDTEASCTIDDPLLHRRLVVAKRGSRATVVWNPGHEKGEAVPDIGDAWNSFVCVETANCGPHAVRLAPRAAHVMTAVISCEDLPPDSRT